ncbi:MAG TPA: HAMP domain-containing sensor histidine kinase [Methylomirabilota bacterium]|nr:HAMP domain-containing sensor histidine kinase [Methylomirabilota bacterium]
MLGRFSHILRKLDRFGTVRSKLTLVILTGSLIVFGALLASQHVDRRSTTIRAADTTHQLITSLLVREFTNGVRTGDPREINRVIIEAVHQLQVGPIDSEYFGMTAPANADERRANLEIAALALYDAAGKPMKIFIAPDHSEIEEDTLSTYAGMARSAARSVTCLEPTREVIAQLIMPAGGGKPIGTLVVAWGMARKFAALDHAFWRDALIGALATLGLVVFLIFVLERALTKPIGALTRHVAELGMSGEPGLVDEALVERHDEIGVLAGEFNKMVEALADSRQKLQNQSYVHGMAEMASGVLHNIRNALNPVSVGIWKLEETARNASLGRIDTALVELATDATPADRRQKLVSYVRAAAEKLVAQQHALADEIRDLGQHSRHIEQILQDVDLTGRRRRQVEQLDLDKLATECAAMIPSRAGSSVTVEIDTALAQLPPALGNRITLTQILGNLMVNAAESIRSAGVAAGKIAVSGRRETVDGKPMLHIEVSDNGEGIAPEAMASLFQRGFSTKKEKKGGIGLHWCANSIIAMGGKIHATSEGKGKGATFHLLLPAAAGRGAENRTQAA